MHSKENMNKWLDLLSKPKVLLFSWIKKLIPAPIRDNREYLSLLYRYLLIGLIARLIFTPFLLQVDILSTYRRAAEFIFQGVAVTAPIQFIVQLLHIAFLSILHPLIPAIKDILAQDNPWYPFVSSLYVFRMLSVLKFPYFLFDLASALLLLRFTQEPRTSLRVFKYWMTNPIVIFAIYVFARHDIIAVFVTIVGLYLALKGRKYWSLFFVGLATLIRFFPALILPFLVVHLARKRRDWVILAAIPISALIILEIVVQVLMGRSPLGSLLNTEHFNFLISLKWDLMIHDAILVFVAAYVLALISFAEKGDKSFSTFIKYGGIVYLLYLSLAYFHPQYVLWLIPFLIFQFLETEKLFYYHIAQVVLLMFILLYWGVLVTTFVFSPIDANFFMNLPDVLKVIERFYSPSKFVNIFRSIFTAVSLWMAYLIYVSAKKESKVPFVVPREDG